MRADVLDVCETFLSIASTSHGKMLKLLQFMGGEKERKKLLEKETVRWKLHDNHLSTSKPHQTFATRKMYYRAKH